MMMLTVATTIVKIGRAVGNSAVFQLGEPVVAAANAALVMYAGIISAFPCPAKKVRLPS